MKKSTLLALSLPLLLAACSAPAESTSATSTPSQNSEATTSSTQGVPPVSAPTTSTAGASVSSSNASSSKQETSVSLDPTQFERTITAAGSYTLTGNINGSILIDAGDEDEIELILNNVTITSTNNSPIYCKNAGELKLKLSGTNTINDNRPQLDENAEDVNQGKGAIYSKCDVKITSSGSLTVNASYNNGIHSTDDIKLKATGAINVTAVNHAIKGNDSVTVEDGTLTLIAKTGSGMKTENTSISSKGNQKGTISITGGQIDIYSREDGIEAAYDVNIESNPTINITTSKYSTYSINPTDTVSNVGNNQVLYAGPGGGGFPGGGWGPTEEGNTDKADYSAKGIKSDNEVYIKGGTITVKAYDDAVHAGRGAELENGSTGLGNVHISGGNLSLWASDDGIHADYINDISGGTINITNSYEGIEGNIVNISGGNIKLYSTDDGLNAADKAGVTPQINVSGGTVDITVYGNDIDGIDSNNTYTQTGGVVITKGGTGGMSTGLDTDGTSKVNSGTLIIFGKPEKTPTKGTGVTSYTLSGSYSIGTYTVSNTTNTFEVTTKYSYTQIYVYSSEATRYTVTKK